MERVFLLLAEMWKALKLSIRDSVDSLLTSQRRSLLIMFNSRLGVCITISATRALKYRVETL
jgi:hypothetical protein